VLAVMVEILGPLGQLQLQQAIVVIMQAGAEEIPKELLLISHKVVMVEVVMVQIIMME
jgi:ABC-type dipeptide/oligopeptide/nickel transport system ATPase subunit